MKTFLLAPATLAASAALAPSALAVQDTTAWTEFRAGERNVVPEHHGIVALAGGDSISVRTVSLDAFDVVRLNADGEVVFETEVPRDIGGAGRGDLVAFDVDAAGSVVLLAERRPFQSDTLQQATRVDATGAILWQAPVDLPNLQSFDAAGVAFAPHDEIVVTGTIPFDSGWTLWHDGNGQLLRWNHEGGEETYLGVAPDGTSRMLRRTVNRVQLLQILADGTRGWTRNVEPTSAGRIKGLWVGPAGQSLTITNESTLSGAVFTLFDAAGQLVWEWTGPESQPRTDSVVFVPGGDVVTSGSTSFGYLRRFTPTGALRFEFGSLNAPDGALFAAVDALDRTWFVRTDTGEDRVHVVDASGQPIDDFQPSFLDDGFEDPQGLFADDRGNVLASVRATSMERGASTSKLTLGEPGAADPGCAVGAANSTGAGARLSAAGSPLAGLNGLTLVVDGLPASTVLLPLVSPDAGFVPGAGGSQGDLCLGGTIGRFAGPGQVRTATADGFASFQVPLDRIPRATGFVQGMAGETWRFQGWYRDANPTSTSNFTSAWAVTLQ
ncbi:MAG: hypothetical protein AAGB93_00260 [Planctomycetota bacterium]